MVNGGEMMEEKIQGVVLLFLSLLMAATLFYDAQGNLWVWREWRQKGLDGKAWRNHAIFEMVCAGVFALMAGLFVYGNWR